MFFFGVLICVAVVFMACRSGRALSQKLECLPAKAMLLAEVKEQGITLEAMEELYPIGLPLFGDSVPAGYMRAWTGFVQGLAGEMRGAGMEWSETYRFWGRAYFAPDGSVDHFFYQWTGKDGNIPTEEWRERFHAVLGCYLDTFRFDFPMNRRFAQCGGVVLKPTE